jgi:hypothetical protein
MKRILVMLVAWAVMAGVSSFSRAADTHATEQGDAHVAKTEHSVKPQHPEAHPPPAHLNYSHPTVPRGHSLWPGTMLIWVALMFVCAMIIGPIVRSEIPPEQAPHTHSHDEPPGASGHHGHSGTIQPGPEHDQAHH